jgi:hypothetical protein
MIQSTKCHRTTFKNMFMSSYEWKEYLEELFMKILDENERFIYVQRVQSSVQKAIYQVQ